MFFIFPWILGLVLFNLIPLFESLLLSFTDYKLTNPQSTQLIGTENFRRIFSIKIYKNKEIENYREEMLKNGHVEILEFKINGQLNTIGVREKGFWQSIINTLIFILIGLPLQLLYGFLVAALLSSGIRGTNIFRLVIYLPTLLPPTVTGVVWKLIFNGRFGPLNHFFSAIGLISPNWLMDPFWIRLTLILINLWSSGGVILIIWAAINNIPVELYEAAKIEGANWWVNTWRITLPMISSTIFFVLSTGIIYGFQIFTLPFILGGEIGGPSSSILFYTLNLYNTALRYNEMGLASAMGVFLLFITILCTWLVFHFSRNHIYYEI